MMIYSSDEQRRNGATRGNLFILWLLWLQQRFLDLLREMNRGIVIQMRSAVIDDWELTKFVIGSPSR